nr:acyltransferase family protein [Bacteroides sp.]
MNKIEVDLLNRIATALIFTAVPFFYTISAYLLFRNLKFDNNGNIINQVEFKNKRWRYLLHILRLYALWFAIYNYHNLYYVVVNQDINLLVKIIKNFFLWGNGHLWYLWGLIIIVPVLSKLVFLKIKPIYLVIIGLGLTCIFRLYSHYGSVEDPSWWQKPLVYMWKGHIVNIFGLFYSFAYMTVGIFMALDNRWKSLSNRYVWIIFIIGIIFCCIDNGGVSIGYQPIAFSIAALCFKWNIKKDSVFIRYSRDLSTYIYLVHGFGITWAYKCCNEPLYGWILSICFSSIMALAIIEIKKIRNKVC